MEHIIPCRSQISDRFPVASFVVRLPPTRVFEVACATDPRLFHTSHRRHRTPANFFTSRAHGLLRTARGDTAWIVPPDQLQRFAGSRRLYYALASYGSPAGDDPHFSIAPTTLDQVPSIAIAADFTGRSLNRARMGGVRPRDTTYGGGERLELTWGGDAVLEEEDRRAKDAGAANNGYDDGHDGSLWDKGQEYDPANDATGDPDVTSESLGVADALATPQAGDVPVDCDDVPADLDQPEARASALAADEASGSQGDPRSAADEDSDSAPECAAEASTLAASPGEDEAYPSRDRESAAADDEEETLGGYEDPAALYGGGNGDGRHHYGSVAPAEGFSTPVATPAGSDLAGRDPDFREEELAEDSAAPAPARVLSVVALDIPEKVRILRVIAPAESGRDGYAAINPDNEYNDPRHPAYHKYHVGLSWGLIQFTQRSGALGKVLRAARDREERLATTLPSEQRLATLFGTQWDELLRITNADDVESRVVPVGGAPLWERSWTDRFRAAGRVPYIIAAQNEVAVTHYVDPVLPVAKWLDFNTARALALLVDRVIHMGLGGGLSWVLASCGPVKTDADREAALRAVGAADLTTFQRSCAPNLRADGRWGPKTHAALVGALRALGSRAPLAPPTRDVMLRQLVDAAAGRSFEPRLRALFDNRTDFDDSALYQLA